MIPAAFEYIRAGSADETLAALAEHGDEAKILAGARVSSRSCGSGWPRRA